MLMNENTYIIATLLHSLDRSLHVGPEITIAGPLVELFRTVNFFKNCAGIDVRHRQVGVAAAVLIAVIL